jgi:hypothetical protein
LGSQVGPLFACFVLLGKQLSASLTGLLKGFLGSIESFLGGLDTFILLLQPFFQDSEIAELSLQEDGRRGTGVRGGHVDLWGTQLGQFLFPGADFLMVSGQDTGQTGQLAPEPGHLGGVGGGQLNGQSGLALLHFGVVSSKHGLKFGQLLPEGLDIRGLGLGLGIVTASSSSPRTRDISGIRGPCGCCLFL